jgi:predicted metalloprotease with PDZ domain
MRKLVCFSFALLFVVSLSAQKVAYKMSFPNAVHHEARIDLTVTGIALLKPAVFKMSRSSPGRYATHEFGKNVYDVSAKDQSGKSLVINRIDGDVYEVPKHTGTITVSYTLYGNYADGTYAGIDPESIHLNMPATFMWMKGLEKAPITIKFELPKENKGVFATQLVQDDDKYNYKAPNLQYFMDSPTKIGDQLIRQWFAENPDGTSFTFRIALESSATPAQADELADKVKKIVNEAKAVYGEFPLYDYGSYTFIAGANPYVNGDGMEHRNSTMITQAMTGFSADRLLGVFSHEYFHNWNVERIRPKTLEPFDFQKSNMSNELWCAEGFTQYYGGLILTRAGLQTSNNFLNTAAGLISTKMNSPGAKFYSPVQASNHAVFVDAAVSIDRNNYSNMFTSYYTYGALIALALDLELQTRYHKTIDAMMQAMWKRFGKTEIPYTVATMQETLASISDAKFANEFFSKYINGHEQIDYASLFAKAGYDITNPAAGKATMGISTGGGTGGRGGGNAPAADKLVIDRNTTKGTAAYEAGLDINDELIKLDGTEVKTQSDLTKFVDGKKPGDAIAVTYKHRGVEKTTTLVLKEQTGVTLVPFETSGKAVTDEMKKIRDSWFTSKTNR